MSKGKKIIFIGSTVVVVFILAAHSLFYYSFDTPLVGIFPSPDNHRLAYLVWHGALMGRTLTLLVSSSNSLNDMRWIGNIDSEDRLRFRELIWSQDNTLVAARCYVVRASSRLSEQGEDGGLFTYGYDFSSSCRLCPPKEGANDPQAWIDLHKKL